MVKSNVKLLLLACFVLFLTSCSIKTTAQTTTSESQNSQRQRPAGKNGPPQFEEILSKMDADKNGKISINEAEGPIKENFTKIDTNKDGFITEDEFKKGAGKPPRKQN